MPTRRQFLTSAAAALTGRAAAADDSVGQLGAANSSVDVVVDQLKDPGGDLLADVDDTGAVDWQGRGFTNLGSVDTDDLDVGGQDVQIALDGFVVPVAPGLGPEDAIDPSGTTTPVDDARTTIKNNADSGAILLPPEPVEESAPLGGAVTKSLEGITIYGWSAKGGSNTQGNASSEIHFTSSGSTSDHGFHFDKDDNNFGVKGNLIVRGPGQGKTSGDAWRYASGPRNHHIDNIYLVDWSGKGFFHENAGGLFESSIERVLVADCDGIPFDWRGANAPNVFGVLKLNPDGTKAMNLDRGNNVVHTVNIGGSVTGGANGEVISSSINTLDGWSIGHINYEPGSQSGVTTVWRATGDGHKELGVMKKASVTTDSLIENAGGGRWWITNLVSNGTENVNHIELTAKTGGTSFYAGPSGQLTDNSGATTGRFRTLKSAGTGHG